MKKTVISLLLSSILFSPAYSVTEQDKEQLLQESHKTIKTFGKTLKGELKAAIKQGGPVNGIQVCNTKAMIITSDVSQNNAVKLSRTSLKVRNAENTPKAWEKTVLESFEARKSQGESPKKMEFSEIVDVNGQKQFRYMKALGTDEVCMNCHGVKVLPAVDEKLSTLYPNDMARGYNVGDIRGAIVLIKNLD